MFQSDKPKTKYQLALLTKLAQQTERYEQMVEFTNRLLLSKQELTPAERNLCASAYKNIVNNRRAQIKVLEAISKKLGNKQNKEMTSALKSYKATIEAEFINSCLQIIKIIQSGKILITWAQPKVFFLKLRGDFYRYLCEIDEREDRYFTNASLCYEEADTIARSRLPPTNQVRLSLHLNMSVFLYERCGEVEKAIQLARQAFDEGVTNVNETNEESYKNCTMILQLLRDNINLWEQQIQG